MFKREKRKKMSLGTEFGVRVTGFRVIAILAAFSGCAAQFAVDAPQPQPAIRWNDSWTGLYQCPTGVQRVEVIQVSQRGRNLVATKLTGDECVPAGFVTWEAHLPRHHIIAADLPLAVNAAVTVGAPGARMARVPARLTILAPDRMIIEGGGGVELTRGTAPPQYGAPPSPAYAPPPQAQPAPPYQGPQPSPLPVAQGAPPAPPPVATSSPPSQPLPAQQPSSLAPSARPVPVGRPGCQPTPVEGISAADRAIVTRILEYDDVPSLGIVKADLNGDGRPDFLVTGSDCGNMRVCGTAVHLSQGEKYINALSTEDADFDQVSELSIDSAITRGVCDMNRDGVRFSWNGKAYRANGKIRPKTVPRPKAGAAGAPPAGTGKKLTFIEKMRNPWGMFDSDPDLEKRFRAVFGRDFGLFLKRMDIGGDVESHDGYLIGQACMRHECSIEDVIFVVNIATEEIHGAILSDQFNHTFHVYGRDNTHPPAVLVKAMNDDLTKK
jgi:hypothetical protein